MLEIFSLVDTILCVKFALKDALLCSTSGLDGTIKFWDTASFTLHTVIPGAHQGNFWVDLIVHLGNRFDIFRSFRKREPVVCHCFIRHNREILESQKSVSNKSFGLNLSM